MVANQFRRLIKNKEQLKALLTEKFPDYKDTINETIPYKEQIKPL